MLATRPSPTLEETVAQILWAAEARPGFDLFFVVANTPVLRDRFIEALRADAEQSEVVDLADGEEGVLPRLERLPAGAGGPVVLIGLESRLVRGREEASPLLGRLNLDRDAIRRRERNLVVLLPAFALTALARGAPDFYDFRTAVMELPTEDSGLGRSPTPYDGSVWALNPEERARWRALLDSREVDRMGAEERIGHAIDLARLDREGGNPRLAVERLQTVLARARQPGIPSLLLRSVLGHLGVYLRELGVLKESLECHQEAEQIGRTIYGDDHPQVAISVNNIGMVLWAQGDLAGALDRYREAERIDRAAYGDDHPSVATDVNNIGSVLRAQGDLAGALDRYREAERIDRAAYGDDHPSVARDVNNIGGVLRAQGDLAGALDRYREAERIDRAAYGDDHPSVARDVNNIGGVLQDQGDLAGARRHYETAFSTLLRAYGPRGSNVRVSANNLTGVGGDPLAIARDIGGSEMEEELRLAIGDALPVTA